MIDIHSHILPGVDDGARDLEQSLSMLRMAVENGVQIQVLTPHIQPCRYKNTPDSLNKAFSDFMGHVQAENIPIELRISTEVRIGSEILGILQQDSFPWLGEWEGRKVFLLEFPQNCIPANSINLIHWLIKRNRLPMIVHPERNSEIQDNEEKLNPFIDSGCLVQITAGSLDSHFGEKAKATALSLIKKDVVTAIASDCHNLIHRPPNLQLGFQIVSSLIGKEKARELVFDNPEKILSGYRVINSMVTNY